MLKQFTLQIYKSLLKQLGSVKQKCNCIWCLIEIQVLTVNLSTSKT